MPVSAMIEAMDERTRCVTASTVTFAPGFRTDLATLGAACRERDVFFLAELEQMSAPEISDTLGVNVNTVYTRLRAARQAFSRFVARTRAGDGGSDG